MYNIGKEVLNDPFEGAERLVVEHAHQDRWREIVCNVGITR